MEQKTKKTRRKTEDRRKRKIERKKKNRTERNESIVTVLRILIGITRAS